MEEKELSRKEAIERMRQKTKELQYKYITKAKDLKEEQISFSPTDDDITFI